ncbi:hypothetical protein E2P81_ATG07413 [Venturia nashicola]|nr:hypothetical protein E2P81_ATG07413 [Venturia nashicola]
MSFTAKPNLTKNQAKPLLHTLILTTPQALIVAINEYAAKPQFSTTRPPVFQAVQHTEHLLLFYQAPDSIPNVLALDNNNRPVQMTSPQETDCVRYSGNDGKAIDALLAHPGVLNILTALREHVVGLIQGLEAPTEGTKSWRNLVPNGYSTLEPLLSELHRIHSEAARPPQPPPPPSIKLPNLCALFRHLRHGHGVMGIRYAYHCLLARSGAQAETLLRRQRSKAEDVEGRGEAQVQYVLHILQRRLEKLVAELEKVGVEVVEEEEEGSVDEQDSQKPSLISALTGEPALSPEQAQERHSLLKNTLSASRILLIAIVDFDLDLSRSRAKVIHLQASLDANDHNIRVLQNVVREPPQYILGHLLFQIYCLHLNAQQPIEQWRPGAKIKRKEESWFTTAHDGGISYVEIHAVEATGLDCGAGIRRRENRRR